MFSSIISTGHLKSFKLHLLNHTFCLSHKQIDIIISFNIYTYRWTHPYPQILCWRLSLSLHVPKSQKQKQYEFVIFHLILILVEMLQQCRLQIGIRFPPQVRKLVVQVRRKFLVDFFNAILCLLSSFFEVCPTLFSAWPSSSSQTSAAIGWAWKFNWPSFHDIMTGRQTDRPIDQHTHR